MGSSCSPEQAKLIVEITTWETRIWLMPDGDEAAIRCAKSVLEQVSPHRFIRWVPLAQGLQPTDIPADTLAGMFNL
jgi:DNA primase